MDLPLPKDQLRLIFLQAKSYGADIDSLWRSHSSSSTARSVRNLNRKMCLERNASVFTRFQASKALFGALWPAFEASLGCFGAKFHSKG